MASEVKSDWYIVQVSPQRELTTVWRFHREDLELHVPLIRRRVKAGGWRGKTQKVRVMAPRAMFPGYGFVRVETVGHPDGLKAIDGVLGYLRDERGRAAILPALTHAAVRAKELEEHRRYLDEKGARASVWKPGDAIRVDEGSVYTGVFGQIEKLVGSDRVAVLLGAANIRHILSANMVVAA